MYDVSVKKRPNIQRRKSGILLHITSLPSRFGIGDLGPAAFAFADFLKEGGQSIWQVLPAGPVSPQYGNSPYSSSSAFAGNPLLISPQLLKKQGLITSDELKNTDFPAGRIDYQSVIQYKQQVLRNAYNSFRISGSEGNAFYEFCSKNAFWLEDFALFETIRHTVYKKRWNRWPEDLRDRRKESLQRLKKKHEYEIMFVKFVQYIFFNQWNALKNYCHCKGIQIMGDMPLYVNHESVDVWSHPYLFSLGSNKQPLVVSGVPPDYYSRTGQLWNNPVYNWEAHKREGYSWWIERIAHSLRLFDLLRFDHFRGLVDFWGVPAGHKTARKGNWLPGPREGLLNLLKERFPHMPFVAEDLGDISDEVCSLRDSFGIPGMRVLQFAFGDGISSDYHKPHNYSANCVAYTGTHDNNTLQGWLGGSDGSSGDRSSEIDRALRYVGHSRGSLQSVHWKFIRVLMMSCANTVIFPLQDVLGVGSPGRMNIPATIRANWEWRVKIEELRKRHALRLSELSSMYGRMNL